MPQVPFTGLASLMTTAGGDGLSFMLGQPNIFELVEALKEGRDLLEPEGEGEQSEDDQPSESLPTEETTEEDIEEEIKPYTDFDLTSLEELPSGLAPVSTIIEIVQDLEKLKEWWRPQT